LLLILLLVVATVRAGGLDWVMTWWMWLIILVSVTLMYRALRGQSLSAGVDWLRVNGGWVRTYELVDIQAHRDPGFIALTLRDSGERRVRMKLYDLQQSREIWDLVYNGILHSVHVNGATTSSLARESLHLD
jgi:hypothetical protein